MPQIIGRAALIRAQLLINEGEYRMAAEVVQKALQISTRYDLELCKILALHLLGRSMAKRKLPEARSRTSIRRNAPMQLIVVGATSKQSRSAAFTADMSIDLGNLRMKFADLS